MKFCTVKQYFEGEKDNDVAARGSTTVIPLSNDFKEGLEIFNQALADHIQNKSVEYVRKFFGIKGNYEPHEEEKYREEYAWAFEGVHED
nr:skp1-like protein 16 [Quercus suber]